MGRSVSIPVLEKKKSKIRKLLGFKFLIHCEIPGALWMHRKFKINTKIFTDVQDVPKTSASVSLCRLCLILRYVLNNCPVVQSFHFENHDSKRDMNNHTSLGFFCVC